MMSATTIVKWNPQRPDLAEKALSRAIANHPSIFKRSGRLCKLVWPRREGPPEAMSLAVAHLKTEVAAVCAFEIGGKKGDVSYVAPFDAIVQSSFASGDWPGIRELVGIITTPFIRPDGTVCQTNGYDEKTGWYLHMDREYAAVPDNPTAEDAAVAMASLCEPFKDFPFATVAGMLSPVAAVLTLLARPAIGGDCPVFAVDANGPGCGKTKLVDIVSIITTGAVPGKMTFSASEEEIEKILGGEARAGRPILTFDNVKTGVPFGGAAIDKALTCSGKLSLRLLGHSQTDTHEWRTVMFATGNNLTFKGDTSRRALVCRLESDLEKPEDREDFAIEGEILAWVHERRDELVCAGLTVLRAYFAAHRPIVSYVKQWGSFEAWNRAIAHAIAWASEDVWHIATGGMDPEPLSLRTASGGDASNESDEMRLLRQLVASFPPGKRTTSELVAMSEPQELREVVDELTSDAKPDKRASVLGYRLRAYKGRVVDGHRLVSSLDRKKCAVWEMVKV